MGLTSKGREGEGNGVEKGKGLEQEERGRGVKVEGRTTLRTPCRKFLATPLTYRFTTLCS